MIQGNMRRIFGLAALMLLLPYVMQAEDLSLRYTSPARVWEEALPVGNGRHGAMVFGRTDIERIQFNENTLYSGEPETPKDIHVYPLLDSLRVLLHEGRNDLAGEIMQREWVGRLNEAYQPFGDLYLDFSRMSGQITGYEHSLDLSRAIVTTSYRQGGTGIRREVFASFPAQAIVIHIEADSPVLSFDAYLGSRHPVRQTASSIPLDMYLLYIVVPVSMALMAINTVRHTLESVRKIRRETASAEDIYKEMSSSW